MNTAEKAIGFSKIAHYDAIFLDNLDCIASKDLNENKKSLNGNAMNLIPTVQIVSYREYDKTSKEVMSKNFDAVITKPFELSDMTRVILELVLRQQNESVRSSDLKVSLSRNIADEFVTTTTEKKRAKSTTSPRMRSLSPLTVTTNFDDYNFEGVLSEVVYL